MKRTKSKLKSKKRIPGGGNLKGNRRYEVGQHPVYDDAYDQAVSGSSVLNPAQRGASIFNFFILDNPKAVLLEIEGDPAHDHHYLNPNNNQWNQAMIPKYLMELRSIYLRFQNWAKQQVKNGSALELPKQMPKELEDLKFKYQALLDVRRAEAEKARSIIAEKEAHKAKKKKSLILKHGPAMQPNSSIAHEQEDNPGFDGQSISYAKGVPYIDCPESPYDKMTLYDYKRMSSAWVVQYRERVLSEWENVEGKGFRNKESGTMITSLAYAGLKKPYNWTVKKEDLPDWPADAKQIKK